MEDLGNKAYIFQQKVADCRVLYLAFGGRHHEVIEREMRALGHESFNRRCLYARNDRGKHTPGWPERFSWTSLDNKSSPPYEGGVAPASGDGVVLYVKEKGAMDHRAENHPVGETPPPLLRKEGSTSCATHDFLTWLKRVSPEYTWTWKYQQYVYKQLKRVTDGLCKRLMIFMPPRHGKSELVTQRYAAWRLKRDPKMRVVVASYNQKLANRFSRGIKRILHQDAEIESRAAQPRTHGGEACLDDTVTNLVSEPAERATYPVHHDPDICPECVARTEWRHSIRDGRDARAVEASLAAVPGRQAATAFRRVNTESEWETREGGGVRAVGVGAGITGFGADLVIIDDPVKGHAQAESATMRENVWEWFNSDIYTRLEPNGAIILIQTRWHEDDLAGRLLREMREDEDAEQWEVIDLPALAEVRSAECGVRSEEEGDGRQAPVPDIPHSTLRTPHSGDPLGRRPGEALCPERFDEKKLERIKKKLGTYAFSALYQQKPVPADGGFFKRHWFKTVDHTPHGVRWKRGYDLGLSAKADADFTATARVGFDRDGNMYIDRVLRKRMEYPEQKRTILRLMSTERETEHLIEESANGSAVIQDLRRDRNLLGRKFRGVRVTKGKTARALAWNALAEEGRVHLVRGPWNSEFITEACSFPLGTYDDQIDAVSLAVEGHGGRGKTLHFFA